MSLSNIIIKGKDNPVRMTITGIKDNDGNPVLLTDFNTVIAKFKNDERDSVNDPNDVLVTDDTLTLYFGDTSESTAGYWTITGINGDYPNGIDLTSCCIGNLGKTEVC